MSSTIVVAVDASPPSRAALAWSVTRSIDTGIPLTLLHAVDPEVDDLVTHASVMDSVYPLIEREHAFATSRGAKTTIEIVRGRPFDCLVAASRDAESLVLGTHKTGFIQGHSIGSRFLELTTMSLCPVAFVPNVPLISRRGVVVAVENSSTGRRAIRLAAAEASRLDQELTFLSVDRELDGRAHELATSSGTALLTKSRVARRGFARELIDASLVASLVVLPHPEARRSVGSAAGALVHDVILNLGGPAIVVPRVDADDSTGE